MVKVLMRAIGLDERELQTGGLQFQQHVRRFRRRRFRRFRRFRLPPPQLLPPPLPPPPLTQFQPLPLAPMSPLPGMPPLPPPSPVIMHPPPPPSPVNFVAHGPLPQFMQIDPSFSADDPVDEVLGASLWRGWRRRQGGSKARGKCGRCGRRWEWLGRRRTPGPPREIRGIACTGGARLAETYRLPRTYPHATRTQHGSRVASPT